MDKRMKKQIPLWIKTVAAVLFWLLVWQVLVLWLDKKSGMPGGNILVASPMDTVKTFVVLVRTPEFWRAVGSSFLKIATGFFLAVAAGVVCAVASAISGVVRVLLMPILRLIKAVPVASFIILALFWLSSSKNLSVLISFLMVLPVIYTNVLQGIESTDGELLEMARVFRISFGKKIRYIYLPAVLPYFVSACSVGLGFCFKSGIAAEIIGLPNNSIGERLYEAKLYLLTEELFAWTAVIVLFSVIFEKVVMLFVKAMARVLAGNRKVATTPEDTAEITIMQEGGAPEETKRYKESENTTFLLPQNKIMETAEALMHTEEASDGYGLFGVTKSFGDKTVLKHCSIAIKDGETLALMGPSGCGKSTAGKLLLGLLLPDEGEVKRPKRMGAVFQEDRLCKEFDAETNIAMVTGDRRTAREALAEVGLSDVQGKPVAALSGGMKRRVAILRALLSDGEVLVFDEPFTGLDAANREMMQNYVKGKLQGRSALLITHNEEEAEDLGDRKIRL